MVWQPSHWTVQVGVDALDVVTPLNTWTATFDITSSGTTFEAALDAAFRTLFGAASGLPITVAVLYGYEIVPAVDGAGGLTACLPVGLYPGQQLGSGTAGAIASALASWQTANQPAIAGGAWVLSLTLYSQIDPSAQRPLLALERLVYRLSPTR
jgi:hypothetical protein